ncbi:MAG: Fe-S cluster assembly protein SufD [Chloroflexi bacterium]|nr:Fe-S cluster assembly protein SufD [Chloroflexota bacterium]
MTTRRIIRRGGPRPATTLTLSQEHIRAQHPALRAHREEAWAIFQELPWPSRQDEPWRRTDIRRMPKQVTLAQGTEAPEPPSDLLRALTDEGPAGELILHGPRVHTWVLKQELVEQGVRFLPLDRADVEMGDWLAERLGRMVRPAEGKFAALAHALAQNGAVLYVPAGVRIARPLHILLWGPGEARSFIDQVLLWLEDGAQATVVIEYASPTAGGPSLHVGTVEVHAGPAARLHLAELQSWGEHMWHFSHERVRVQRDAEVHWIYGGVGSRLTKAFLEVDLVEQGATAYISGFYFGHGRQHLDHDTQQNHLAPHTTSDLLFKGALKDQARSVWQGMIYVAPEAQHTDGYQANRNLILSREARVDSIPGLEIMANDVRCTHGATLGRIDEEQVFYLRTRGLSETEARRLIIEGFFEEVLARLPYESVRTRFHDVLEAKMG